MEQTRHRRIREGHRWCLENINLNEDGRINRTSIIGEVQSGKHIDGWIAVKGLDAGFRLIIVLAGHQNDLRNQAAKRFNRDLLLISEKNWTKPLQYWTIEGAPAVYLGFQKGFKMEKITRDMVGSCNAYSLLTVI